MEQERAAKRTHDSECSTSTAAKRACVENISSCSTADVAPEEEMEDIDLADAFDVEEEEAEVGAAAASGPDRSA